MAVDYMAAAFEVSRPPAQVQRRRVPVPATSFAVTDGSLTEKVNKTGVRLWTGCSDLLTIVWMVLLNNGPGQVGWRPRYTKASDRRGTKYIAFRAPVSAMQPFGNK